MTKRLVVISSIALASFALALTLRNSSGHYWSRDDDETDLKFSHTLHVKDNGIGFDMEQVLHNPEKWDHFGVRGIVERAKLVGGEARIDSKKGRGTTIVVEVPLGKKESEDDGKD